MIHYQMTSNSEVICDAETVLDMDAHGQTHRIRFVDISDKSKYEELKRHRDKQHARFCAAIVSIEMRNATITGNPNW